MEFVYIHAYTPSDLERPRLNFIFISYCPALAIVLSLQELIHRGLWTPVTFEFPLSTAFARAPASCLPMHIVPDN